MSKSEKINNFTGFGTGGKTGEYTYSQGIRKSTNGVMPGWSVADVADNSSLTTLSLPAWFTEGRPSTNNYVFSADTSGYLYSALSGASWSLLYKPSTTTHGNGLKIDQKNRLLYATDRYLGKYDGTDNYTTGTITATNSSTTITGSGTTFTSGMVGKRLRIGTETTFYKVATYVSATEITLTSAYTGTTGSGKTYTIYTAWTDEWKDFGASYETTDYRESDTFEDWILWGNINTVAGLNTSDDSFNASLFSFPTGFSSIRMKTGKSGVLLGANFNNRSVVCLWQPGYDRSISPWIWYNAPIRSIVLNGDEWIVMTTKGLFRTNGYSSVPLLDSTPDELINGSSLTSNLPQGANIINNKLVFWSMSSSEYNRRKDGLYILDLSTKLFEFTPVEDKCLRGITGGAVFFDSYYRTHLGYSQSSPAKNSLAVLANNASAPAYLITEKLGQGDNDKVAEAITLSLGVNQEEYIYTPYTFDVYVKIFNFKRLLWSYGITNALSGSTSTLSVNGTVSNFNKAKVGDEVTILDGVNAGKIRHITQITGEGTSSEVWTLDSALPNLTADGTYLSVQPFELVKKHTITNQTELSSLLFNVKNRIKGKHFLAKIVFDNIQSYCVPEIHEGEFIYSELNPKK